MVLLQDRVYAYPKELCTETGGHALHVYRWNFKPRGIAFTGGSVDVKRQGGPMHDVTHSRLIASVMGQITVLWMLTRGRSNLSGINVRVWSCR